IINGKRHCGIFIDIPLSDIDEQSATTPCYIYPLTQSECYIFCKRARQSLDLNDISIKQKQLAENGTVWMYDATWYNSGDIVPDQVTPASDATPLSDGTATAGISTEYSRGDHVHPQNVTITIPSSDFASGSVGTTNYYARNDHSHPLNITTTISPQDSASGAVGTTNHYARNDHSHPINVETNASNIPIVSGVGANGTSAFYARHDHVHPQQLTYDGNVTATKLIKTGGTASEVLCANGDTTTIDSKFSRTYSSGAGGYIRLCVFPIGTSTGAPYIQFQVTCNTNAMQTIDLVPNYTVNGIVCLYGVFTAPSYVQPAYNIYQGADQLLHTHTGSSISFAGVTCGAVQIYPMADNFNEGLRISRSSNRNNVFWRAHPLTMGSVPP
ncbi:MAG: hypothetical protein EZS28_026332, partial [Streblomastix strix]